MSTGLKDLLLIVLGCYSAAFTSLAAFWVVRRGGLRYAIERLGPGRRRTVYDGWQRDWIARHRALPDTEDEVVFAGDSITATMPWADFYSDIRNRGIGGDTSDGLLGRIDEIAASRPKQVFINIGTNDLSVETPAAEVAANIRAIVDRLRSASPSTEAFVVSVLPINVEVDPGVVNDRKRLEIGRLNRLLEEQSSDSGYEFIDLNPFFLDDAGHLRREWTADGLHLSTEGELRYCELLTPHVRSRDILARKDSAALRP